MRKIVISSENEHPTWKNTLCGDNPNKLSTMDLNRVAYTAEYLGYTYFTWNGKVVRVIPKENRIDPHTGEEITPVTKYSTRDVK